MNLNLSPKFESDYINPDLAVSPWSTNRIFVYNLVRTINPSAIIELGTHMGCSLFCFTQAIKDYNLSTKIIAIDSWNGDPITGIYDGDASLRTVKQTISRFYKNVDIKLIRSYFDDALIDIPDESAEIIHIDGNHSYESIKIDYHNWLPKLKNNGIMLFHDIGNLAKKNKYGSYNFWQEIKRKHPYIEQTHLWGLGILFPKGSKYRHTIIKLRPKYFSELQTKILFNIQNNDLTNMVKERDKYIKKLEKRLDQTRSENNSLPKEVPKIAFLLGSPDISGGTYVIFKHALALQKKGYIVTIITDRSFDDERLFWMEEAKALNFVDLNTASNNEYDLCIATWWKTIFYLPKLNTKKIAYFVQSVESKFCKASDRDLKELIDFTYTLPIYFITETHWIQKYLSEAYNQNVIVVLNGIDKNIFNTKGEILDPSRPKGTRVLIEGALNVFFKQTELSVDIANKSGIKDIWLLTPSQTESFPGVSRVFSQIPMKDVGKIMRSCDIILKLSKVEGMFGPPLEMMHCGGTAVTFDVTGYDEYLKDGVNSLVYQMDDIVGVIDGLSKVSKDTIFLSHLKKNALKMAATWPDWETSSNNFVKSIDSIVNDQKLHSNKVSIDCIKAAIELSGPIHTAMRYPYTISNLLLELKRLVISKLKRKVFSTGSLKNRYSYKPINLKIEG